MFLHDLTLRLQYTFLINCEWVEYNYVSWQNNFYFFNTKNLRVRPKNAIIAIIIALCRLLKRKRLAFIVQNKGNLINTWKLR